MLPCEKTPLRLLLITRQTQKALKILDRPGLFVCGTALRWEDALHALHSLMPHAVVFFDTDPPSAQTLDRIRQLMPLTPPRIVCEQMQNCAADAVFDPMDPASLGNAVFSSCAAPMGLLAAPSYEKRLSAAQSLLDSLGMNPHLKGRACIACGAAWLSAVPHPVPPAQYLLYPQLAKAFDTTPAAIERRIRSAVESTWLHGNLQSQSDLFGLTVSAERGKPTNAEFLFLLSEHIKRLLC